MGCYHCAGCHRNGTGQSVWGHAVFGYQARNWPLNTQRWVYDPAEFCDQPDPDPRHGHELSGIYDIICTRGRYRNVPDRAQSIGKPSGRHIASSGAHIPDGFYDFRTGQEFSERPKNRLGPDAIRHWPFLPIPTIPPQVFLHR